MPAKPPKYYEAHIYLSKEELEKVKAIADRESRSVNKQIAYYVREGLKREPKTT
jgi:hypothetical protein